MCALHAVEIVTVSKFVTCFVRCFSNWGTQAFWMPNVLLHRLTEVARRPLREA